MNIQVYSPDTTRDDYIKIFEETETDKLIRASIERLAVPLIAGVSCESISQPQLIGQMQFPYNQFDDQMMLKRNQHGVRICSGIGCRKRKGLVFVEEKGYVCRCHLEKCNHEHRCEVCRRCIRNDKKLRYTKEGVKLCPTCHLKKIVSETPSRPPCHWKKCESHDTVDFYHGFFCSTHLERMHSIRARIGLHQRDEDELSARIEEVNCRKDASPGHIEYIWELAREIEQKKGLKDFTGYTSLWDLPVLCKAEDVRPL